MWTNVIFHMKIEVFLQKTFLIFIFFETFGHIVQVIFYFTPDSHKNVSFLLFFLPKNIIQSLQNITKCFCFSLCRPFQKQIEEKNILRI